MPNPQNLKPINKMSPEEKEAFIAKGREAHKQKCKEKRAMRELLEVVCAQPAIKTDGSQIINPATGKPLNLKEAAAVILARKAASGELKAIRLLAEVMGELKANTEISGDIIINCHES